MLPLSGHQLKLYIPQLGGEEVEKVEEGEHGCYWLLCSARPVIEHPGNLSTARKQHATPVLANYGPASALPVDHCNYMNIG